MSQLSQGGFQSGYGHFTLVSGSIVPGQISLGTPRYVRVCDCCKKETEGTVWVANAIFSSGPVFCHKCAGFDWMQYGGVNGNGFDWLREAWIRESVPLMSKSPAGILSDFMEECGRQKDAEYLRARYSGRLDEGGS